MNAAMKTIFFSISLAALAGTLVPAFLLLSGAIDLRQTQQSMILSTIAWFIAAPFWLKQKETK